MSSIPVERRTRSSSMPVAARSSGGDDSYDVSWEGRDAYDARCGPIVARQMARAGQNLAKLLDAMWP
jgi:hypothetical protein